MTQGLIYMVDGEGALHRMTPSAPSSEDRMQTLVAQYPELISDGDGDLLLIRREQPIADSEDNHGRWSLDHLFVTREAVPVLVELKRAVDTRLRREVVGQILDYAANATAYWQAGRVADSFAKTAAELGYDPEEQLREFLDGGDAEGFWRQVDSNFIAGRMKLVFVADNIPRELARIVEFLNDQMRADVRAVELRWFSGDGGVTTLSPRVIGETERAAAAKANAAGFEPLDRDTWIAKYLAPLGESVVSAANTYIALVEDAGGSISCASTGGSIIAIFPCSDPKFSEMYPFHLWRQKNGASVSLSLNYLQSRSIFADEGSRQKLYESASEMVGPLSTTNLAGFPAFPLTRLNEPKYATGFRALIDEVVAAAG